MSIYIAHRRRKTSNALSIYSKFHNDRCNCFPWWWHGYKQSYNKKLSCHGDCAMLCVTEYFAKSLKFIQNDILQWGVCKSLLVFHWNYVCILYCFWDIQHQIIVWPWNRG